MDQWTLFFVAVVTIIILVWITLDYLNRPAPKDNTGVNPNYSPLIASFNRYPSQLWMTDNLRDFDVLSTSVYRYRIMNNSGIIIYDNRSSIQSERRRFISHPTGKTDAVGEDGSFSSPTVDGCGGRPFPLNCSDHKEITKRSTLKDERLQDYFEVWQAAVLGAGQAYREGFVNAAIRVGGKGDNRVVHISGPNVNTV